MKASEFINTKTYSVDDFKKDVFESWHDYSNFMMSPKSRESLIRTSTKSWPAKYINFLYTKGGLTESTVTQTARLEAETFSKEFKKLDQRKKVKIAIGQKIAILSAWIDLDRTEIALTGNTQLKTIKSINLNNDGTIDIIVFEDGTQYPERGELVNIYGQNITNTIFFADETNAEKAYTKSWMLLTNLEGFGWKINTNLNEDITENDDDPYKSVSRIKRQIIPVSHKPSKLQELCKAASINKGDNVFVKVEKNGKDDYEHCAFLRAGEKMIHVQNYTTGQKEAVEPKVVYTQEKFKYVPLVAKRK